MDLKLTVGNNIVKYRKNQRLTQQELAYRSEISISHLRNIEHGTGNTTLEILERLSGALSVAPEELLKHGK